ncbi:hypothetical protein EYE35_20145 [Cereibacter sphaeroides]|nr:hypothetical protein EYE35_20145 [Cereibacter sphaeroides]
MTTFSSPPAEASPSIIRAKTPMSPHRFQRLRVSRQLGAETVLISVTGMPPEGAAPGAAPAAETRSEGFELAGGEGGGSYASQGKLFRRSDYHNGLLELRGERFILVPIHAGDTETRPPVSATIILPSGSA